MKVEREVVVPVFEPIVITIESIDELKWFLAIANTSVAQAREQVANQGFKLIDNAHIQQMSLYDSVKQYKGDVL